MAPPFDIASVNESTSFKKEDSAFTLLPKLPLELRGKIWKEACFEPRIIDIWVQGLLEDPSFADSICSHVAAFVSDDCSYHSHSAIPAVMHACRESRATGLKHYCLEFSTKFEMNHGRVTINVSTPARIFVNWECDIVCPINLRHFTPCMIEDLVIRASPMKHLALPIDCADYFERFLQLFNPEEIILYSQKLYISQTRFEVEKRLALSFSSMERSSGQEADHSQAAGTLMAKDCTMAVNVPYMKTLLRDIDKFPDITLAVMDIADT